MACVTAAVDRSVSATIHLACAAAVL